MYLFLEEDMVAIPSIIWEKIKEGILVGARNNDGGPLWMTVQLVTRTHVNIALEGWIFTCPFNGQNYCTNTICFKTNKKDIT